MAIEVFNSTRSPDLIGPIDSRHPPIEVNEFPAADPASISFANSSALGIFTPVPPNPNMGRRYRTTRKDRGIRTQKAFPFNIQSTRSRGRPARDRLVQLDIGFTGFPSVDGCQRAPWARELALRQAHFRVHLSDCWLTSYILQNTISIIHVTN